ncbi:MAG: ACT domain-containing protein, partial [Oscillospiraceae bacterium]|nr:ACT domain-containing protein [Oscillospiraceae bacterium]
ALEDIKSVLGFDHISTEYDVAKVSVVGAGMMNTSGIASLVFEALYDAKVNIQIISTSEIKISVIVAEKEADRAVQAIHDKFFD